jgi:hypothetical protein
MWARAVSETKEKKKKKRRRRGWAAGACPPN